MKKYNDTATKKINTIRVLLGIFARYFLMDLPFKKITYEREILSIEQLCILLCNTVHKKIAQYSCLHRVGYKM
jgi:hypothetical protein